ncbi:hypothetical protein C8R45DRAFT_965520 [Mycena sanguinolenta]|nr:hypothetical protein C8R45DRAFT_965520 [Mycena sanguinolenta]
MDGASLPSEIWLYIHRIATADSSPMVAAYSDRFQYMPVSDPLKDPGQFWRLASSFVLVSRLWNSLANELLYENVRVDETFDAHLRPALERSDHANLVRCVRLSPNRLDHNFAVLAMCPRLQVIVQPEATRDLNSDAAPFVLSSSQSLRHIYCEESAKNSAFLRRLVALAPNLEYLFLSHSPNFQTDEEALAFPTISNLRRLSVVPVVPNLTTAILKTGMQNVTRLTCSPSLFRLPDLPVFHSLRLLDLFGSRSNIDFASIFSQCPRLEELCYDVWSTFHEPEQKHAPLACIRLHSAAYVVRDWTPIKEHFRHFLSPEFPHVQRLVLHNAWYKVIDDPLFAPIRDGLRAQGCVLEFPEGYVRS